MLKLLIGSPLMLAGIAVVLALAVGYHFYAVNASQKTGIKIGEQRERLVWEEKRREAELKRHAERREAEEHQKRLVAALIEAERARMQQELEHEAELEQALRDAGSVGDITVPDAVLAPLRRMQ